MKINIYQRVNKIIYDEKYHQFKLSENPVGITVYPDKVKLYIGIKVELHLRNSEAVIIPYLSKNWLESGIYVSSHNWKKPISGTHDGLFITLSSKVFDFTNLDKDSIKDNLTFLILSKHYTELLSKKDVDGIMSVPIDVNIYEGDTLIYGASKVDQE